MFEEKQNKKIKKKYIVLIILLLMLSIFSVSYAVLSVKLVGERKYSLTIGTLDFKLDNEQNAIRLMNAYPMSDTEGQALTPYTFTLKNTGTLKEYYKISLVTAKEQQASCSGCTFLSPNKLRYSLKVDGVLTKTRTVSEDLLLDVGELSANETKNYELRLWLNSEATIEEENKYYFGKIKVDASQEEYSSELGEKAFKTENLGEKCKTYDDGVDTFLVGQCSQNYVWYSGKLWKVVLKNNATGAVKMITDNSITAIPYYWEETDTVVFANSYADQWLNQEFLPTLHDYEDYLVVDSVWDASINPNRDTTRPTQEVTVIRPVGMLNDYEYLQVHKRASEFASHASNYLCGGAYYWLLNPDYTTTTAGLNINQYGQVVAGYIGNGRGIRPSINLKPTIITESGIGTRDNPYILKGDIQEVVKGETPLSTRYSGEYLTFNNELYRIVLIENGLTKITSVDKPSELTSNVFHAATGVTSFADAGIKTDLENYYQNMKIANLDSYNMIEPNTTWYLGLVTHGQTYKASVCKTIDDTKSINQCTDRTTSTTANIGLPRVGEMFSSQITRGTRQPFWQLTPYTNTAVRYVKDYNSSSSSDPTGAYGARPSMYLKSNVVIASDNTGNGTYEHPYKLSMN